ncbi:MAG: PstS family phosphate ABC transporter substrate-binding protein [Armatimonadetes bacterium]|nr:PstS family phosphate ABC transporter substrate-binding protein [Armatimonadota bacterium]
MNQRSLLNIAATCLAASAIIALQGCGDSKAPETTAKTTTGGGAAAEAGTVTIDGSNTVYPIMEAASANYKSQSQDKITVGKAGTGAGMKKFIAGEIDIADASRPIKKDEDAKLQEAKRDYIEVAVAYDGLCIVVNPKNQWLKSITLDQLHKIWDKASTVKKWNEVDPSWPAQDIKLVGPTSAHGTYEYFNEVVNKDGKNTRQDYSQQAEYDGVVGVVGRDENALGYMGFSYAELNADKVHVVPVDAGKGPITPSKATILDGTCAPFCRPLLAYIDAKALDSKPAVKKFLEYFLDTANAGKAVTAAGYVPLPDDLYQVARDRVAKKVLGSVTMAAVPGTPYKDLVAAKK